MLEALSFGFCLDLMLFRFSIIYNVYIYQNFLLFAVAIPSSIIKILGPAAESRMHAWCYLPASSWALDVYESSVTWPSENRTLWILRFQGFRMDFRVTHKRVHLDDAFKLFTSLGTGIICINICTLQMNTSSGNNSSMPYGYR